MKFINPVFYGVITLFFCPLLSQPISAKPMDDCVLETFANGNNAMTIGEIKQVCAKQLTEPAPPMAVGPVDSKLDMDVRNTLEPFTLMAHKPNFFMVTYDGSREDIDNYGGITGLNVKFDDVELQFQVSIKTPLAVNLFDQKIDVYSAYTNRSFWQAFNDNEQNSAFFRETNHEPEIWVQKRHNLKLPLGFYYKLTSMGFVHQSNGRSGDKALNPGALSRSWNRIYGNFVLEKGDFVVCIKPWLRIPEDREEDDNSDISDYLGHGEIRLAYKLDEQTFALMSRNNLESGFSNGAVEVSWSFPLWKYPYVKGYFQYFTGYGESLADYNQYNQRIGLGISLSDWL